VIATVLLALHDGAMWALGERLSARLGFPRAGF
jgi:hypothetical protein